MSEQEQNNWGERLSQGYHRMLERVRARLYELDHDTGPALRHAVDEARERATELGELTREEAERVGDYLQRDLQDAAGFLEREGRELGNWLRFDFALVERGLADLFADAVDKTRIELQQFSTEAEAFGEWHSGEITAFGSFQCKSCGEELHLKEPSRLPPCPRCHGTTFRRTTESD